MKRGKPYPGISSLIDRHGKRRFRFRMKGKRGCYINHPYGSKEFEAAYYAAVDGDRIWVEKSRVHAKYSFDWLIERYMRTATWADIGKIYKYNLGRQIERFRLEHGKRDVRQLKKQHVETLMAQKHDKPSSANELLKLIGRLCRFAIDLEIIAHDPTRGIKKFKTNPDGYHTWTDDEVSQFEAHHGFGSKAVLAMRLMLFTGAAREDAAALGWQNYKNGRIRYQRIKTGGDVDLPVHPDLATVLAECDASILLFVTHHAGKAYSPDTFGMWFGEMCKLAGVIGRAHGLRKAGATRLANAGATEFEVMAFLGHRTPNEARTYVKKASRAKLGDSGMEKLLKVSNQDIRLDGNTAKQRKIKDK